MSSERRRSMLFVGLCASLLAPARPSSPRRRRDARIHAPPRPPRAGPAAVRGCWDDVVDTSAAAYVRVTDEAIALLRNGEASVFRILRDLAADFATRNDRMEARGVSFWVNDRQSRFDFMVPAGDDDAEDVANNVTSYDVRYMCRTDHDGDADANATEAGAPGDAAVDGGDLAAGCRGFPWRELRRAASLAQCAGGAERSEEHQTPAATARESAVPTMMVSTPTFGSCILSGVPRCVLSPASCTPSETYRPAGVTSGCDDPGKIQVGRCTGATDDFRCAATRDACFDPLAFDPTGGTGGQEPVYYADQVLGECTLRYGLGDEGYTLFPLCWDKAREDAEGRPRGVLFKEECNGPTEDLISSTSALDWRTYDTNKCHKVPVGVCHAAGLAPADITADNAYCAVGKWDCRDERPTYLSAKETAALTGLTCRLCSDTQLRTGACVRADTGGVTRCALERTACPPGSLFRSSQELAESGLVTTRVEATCLSALDVPLGECASANDEVECAPHADTCFYVRQFEQRSNCNLLGNDDTKSPTYYGTCGGKPDQEGYDYRNFRCVWGRDECHPTLEAYRPAQLPNGCTCDQVQTGVCIEEDENGERTAPYCAVSADACSSGTPSTYVPARDLAASGLGDFDCRLCRDHQDFVRPIVSNALENATPRDEMYEETEDSQSIAVSPSSSPSGLSMGRSTPPPASVPITPVDVPPRSFPEPLPDSSVESLFKEFEEEPQTAFLLVASILGAGLAAFLLIVGFALACDRLGKKTNDRNASNPIFEEPQAIGEDSGEGSSSLGIT